MEQIKFISLEKKYADAVIRLEPQIYTHGWSAKLILSEFDKPISRRFGLLENDLLIGYSFSYVVEDELHLLNLGIDPIYRGRGYGTCLLENIIKESFKEGCTQCLLEVRRSNLVAQNLYHSLGFKINGVRPRYYSDNQEDALLMVCNFHQPECAAKNRINFSPIEKLYHPK